MTGATARNNLYGGQIPGFSPLPADAAPCRFPPIKLLWRIPSAGHVRRTGTFQCRMNQQINKCCMRVKEADENLYGKTRASGAGLVAL